MSNVTPPLQVGLPTGEQIEKLESALGAGCTHDEAMAHAKVSRRSFTEWLATVDAERVEEWRRQPDRTKAAVKVMEAKVVEKLPDIIDGQISDAISAESANERTAAGNKLLDRVFGKATERVDVTSGGEKLARFEMTPEVAVAMRNVDAEIEKQLREK